MNWNYNSLYNIISGKLEECNTPIDFVLVLWSGDVVGWVQRGQSPLTFFYEMIHYGSFFWHFIESSIWRRPHFVPHFLFRTTPLYTMCIHLTAVLLQPILYRIYLIACFTMSIRTSLTKSSKHKSNWDIWLVLFPSDSSYHQSLQLWDFGTGKLSQSTGRFPTGRLWWWHRHRLSSPRGH